VIKPYYADDLVTLYLGDVRTVLPELGVQADAVIADPPYDETSLAWDRWPAGWPTLAAEHARSMWCFGSLRMFMERGPEFAAGGWKLSHDTVGEFDVDTAVWEKHNGSSFHTDRIRRVHELMAHWYRGPWSEVYREVPVTNDARARTVRRKQRPPHTGDIGRSAYSSVDGGPRLLTSVIRARSMHGRAIHPTEKPGPVLAPLIEYAVPLGGLVLDLFAGSCAAGLTARQLGRRAICIEGDEPYLERAAERLAVPDLFAAAGMPNQDGDR